jgi:O-antigen ligase
MQDSPQYSCATDVKRLPTSASNALSLFAFILIVVPWINPFAPGPTPAVVPLLVAWVCIALLILTWVGAGGHPARSPRVRAIAIAWVAAAALSALVGLLQYLGDTAWLGSWVSHPGVGQAYGNLRQRNQFASLMNIGLAAVLWCASTWPVFTPTRLAFLSTQIHQYMAWCFLLVLAALLGIGNAVSSSRTGLFQLGMVFVFCLLWYQRASLYKTSADTQHATESRGRVYSVLIVAVLAYSVASVMLPGLIGLDPLGSGAVARLREGDPACASRLTLWRNVVYLIAQKPWLGWGWGELDYAHFITLYPMPRFCDILDNAHNLPLHLAVELGLPAALLVCAIGIYLVWLAKPWRETNATCQLAWTVLAVILLHSLLEYPLWYGPFQMAVGLCGYLLWPKISTKKMAITPYCQALVTIVIIAFCAFAAWQYQLASQIYLSPEQRRLAYREDTITKTREVFLFQDQVLFAELTTTDVNPNNAAYINALAIHVLHFSPEASVAEQLIESAYLLGRKEEARFYMARYQAAFAQAFAQWRTNRSGVLPDSEVHR